MSKQDKDVVEGNKLIAEFMNLKSMKWDFDGTLMKIWIDKDTEITVYDKPDLQYHSSWDWLMPVVEKIEALGNYGVEISHFSCHIYEMSIDPSDLVIEGNFNSKIEATWQAVIQFIQWYNNHQKQVKE